jgi:hypothetical protein
MPDAKISALPSVTDATPDAVIPIVQLVGGVKTTLQLPLNQIVQDSLITSGLPNLEFVFGDDGDFVVVG